MNYFTIPGLKVCKNISDIPKREEELKEKLLAFCSITPKYKFLSSWFIITRKGRKRQKVAIRQMYCYVLKTIIDPTYPLKEIGEEFENQDHTTVIHSIKTTKHLLETEHPETTRLFNYLNT